MLASFTSSDVYNLVVNHESNTVAFDALFARANVKLTDANGLVDLELKATFPVVSFTFDLAYNSSNSNAFELTVNQFVGANLQREHMQAYSTLDEAVLAIRELLKEICEPRL